MNFSPFDAIDVIDIVLYKYNYYDNRIWTGSKNELEYIQLNPDSILVSPKSLKHHLERKYTRDLNKFKSIGSEFIHKEANSIFFINKILTQMSRVKWVKLTLNKSKNYSRMVNDGETKNISFSYKVLHATIRLYEIFLPEELAILNKILLELELLIPGIPYKRNNLDEMVMKLENRLNTTMDDEEIHVAGLLLDMLDPKIESDNPQILLVTDY